MSKKPEPKTKTLAELLAEDQPKTVFVPALDCKISYREPSLGDFPDLAKMQEINDSESKLTFVHTLLLKTWGKADDSVTEESLDKLGLTTCMAIVEAIGGIVFTPSKQTEKDRGKP